MFCLYAHDKDLNAGPDAVQVFTMWDCSLASIGTNSRGLTLKSSKPNYEVGTMLPSPLPQL